MEAYMICSADMVDAMTPYNKTKLSLNYTRVCGIRSQQFHPSYRLWSAGGLDRYPHKMAHHRGQNGATYYIACFLLCLNTTIERLDHESVVYLRIH